MGHNSMLKKIFLGVGLFFYGLVSFAENPPASLQSSASPGNLFQEPYQQFTKMVTPERIQIIANAGGQCQNQLLSSVVSSIGNAGLQALMMSFMGGGAPAALAAASGVACGAMGDPLTVDCNILPSVTQGMAAANEAGMQQSGPSLDSMMMMMMMMDCSVASSMVTPMLIVSQATICKTQCQLNQMQSLQREMSCIKAQQDALSQELGKLALVCANNERTMTKYIQDLKNRQDDQKAKLKDTQRLLRGDEGSGAPGLIALNEAVEKALVNMPASIQKLNTQYKNYTMAEKSFDDKVKQLEIASSMRCLQTPIGSMRCPEGSAPLSPIDFLVCRVRQSQLSVLNLSDTQTKQAQRKADALSQDLKNMIASAPNMTQMPTNEKESLVSMQAPVTLLNIEDIPKVFGNQLKSYRFNQGSQGSISALDFVMDMMKKVCEPRAKRNIQRQLQGGHNSIAIEKHAIQIAADKLQADIQAEMTRNVSLYDRLVTGFPGVAPLDVRQCQKVSAPEKIQCLENIRKSFIDVVRGGAKETTFQILGNSQPDQLKCKGLNQCVQMLQKHVRTVESNYNQLVQIQKQSVVDYNQSMKLFASQVAGHLSELSRLIQFRTQKVNAALARMGNVTGVTMTPIKGEKLQFDENGLVQTPTNITSYIGSLMVPPLTEPQSMLAGLDDIKVLQKSLTTKYDQAIQQQMIFPMIQKMCASQAMRHQGAQLVNLTEAARHCYFSPICQNDQFGRLQSMSMRIASHPTMMSSPMQSMMPMMILGQGNPDMMNTMMMMAMMGGGGGMFGGGEQPTRGVESLNTGVAQMCQPPDFIDEDPTTPDYQRKKANYENTQSGCVQAASAIMRTAQSLAIGTRGFSLTGAAGAH